MSQYSGLYLLFPARSCSSMGASRRARTVLRMREAAVLSFGVELGAGPSAVRGMVGDNGGAGRVGEGVAARKRRTELVKVLWVAQVGRRESWSPP